MHPNQLPSNPCPQAAPPLPPALSPWLLHQCFMAEVGIGER